MAESRIGRRVFSTKTFTNRKDCSTSCTATRREQMTMMNNQHSEALPNEGEATYFVKVHLDTLNLVGPHPTIPECRLYALEGKARPMLVLRVLPGRERGRRWLLVLPITSKGLDGRGNRRTDVEPIGNCLDSCRESFVEMSPQKLPDNMICRTDEGRIHRPPLCDRQAFANAVKVLTWKVMKSGG